MSRPAVKQHPPVGAAWHRPLFTGFPFWATRAPMIDTQFIGLYGSFARSVTLPAGADDDGITGCYDNGILTVSVTLTEAPPADKHAVQT